MNFFKVRQKSTGLFYNGSRSGPAFDAHGERYDVRAPATAGYRFLSRKWYNRLLAMYASWEARYPGRPNPSHVNPADVRPDNLEVVEFAETQVKVHDVG